MEDLIDEVALEIWESPGLRLAMSRLLFEKSSMPGSMPGSMLLDCCDFAE